MRSERKIVAEVLEGLERKSENVICLSGSRSHIRGPYAQPKP